MRVAAETARCTWIHLHFGCAYVYMRVAADTARYTWVHLHFLVQQQRHSNSTWLHPHFSSAYVYVQQQTARCTPVHLHFCCAYVYVRVAAETAVYSIDWLVKSARLLYYAPPTTTRLTFPYSPRLTFKHNRPSCAPWSPGRTAGRLDTVVLINRTTLKLKARDDRKPIWLP